MEPNFIGIIVVAAIIVSFIACCCCVLHCLVIPENNRRLPCEGRQIRLFTIFGSGDVRFPGEARKLPPLAIVDPIKPSNDEKV